MYLIRPARKEDLESIKALAAMAGPGMTTLPENQEYLENRIIDSLRAFDRRIRKPGGESYLFVLENTHTQEVLGTAGIVSKVGGFKPYYTFKIKKESSQCEELNARTENEVLHFTANHNGPAEIGSLFLSPKIRQKGLARLLSLSRFLFMAEFPGRFDRRVISELRGWMDEGGKSPFWEGIGKSFFNTDFFTADFLSGTGHKEFIAKLMPKHPIYTALLPQPVRDAIGKVHREAEPALALLNQEGFVYNQEVDIFDAGPTVTASLDEIRTVHQSQTAPLGPGNVPAEPEDHLISNTRIDYRACAGHVTLNSDGTLSLAEGVRSHLRLKSGDPVRFVSIRD